jgi:hypothetical protein
LAGLVSPTVAEPDGLELGCCAVATLCLSNSKFDERERDVRPGRNRRKEMKPLEDDSHIFEAAARALCRTE